MRVCVYKREENSARKSEREREREKEEKSFQVSN